MHRLRTASLILAVLATASPALAQAGRVTGVVQDVNGRPIHGATIRAFNEEAYPRERTSTTDERGRWTMLGLRITPNWQFTVEAPGYVPEQAILPVRSTVGRPFTFTLRTDPGPIPGALAADIAERLSAANDLRDEGRYDEAIAAYLALRTGNEKLTSLGLVLGGVYRMKAAAESQPAARRDLLERAAAAYAGVLDADADNARARAEMAAVQVALSESK